MTTTFSLRPDALPAKLTDNAWLVEQIAALTDRPIEEVQQRLYTEEQQIGSNVMAAMERMGIRPHVWSDDLVRFYQQTDAFLYELVAWNRNANKVAIRQWMNEVFGRLPSFSLDVLTYGDGIGCDSLYLTQAGHRVTYCDLGMLGKRFAQSLFDAAGLPFAPTDDLTGLPAEAFDAIVCLDVLEHVPDPPSLVEQLARCLRPGGLLIASAPFFAIDPQFPTHLASNRRHSGSLRRLYGRCGLQLVDGRPFLDPVVLSKPPVTYQAGAGGVMRRATVRSGAMLLKVARWWSWPHRHISRMLQRRGYRYMVDGLQAAPAAVVS
ncbi:MAG: class I SAM-dependent methyltransferase [Planctomycetes bacterium]|nr:class I SAM-dependent methyltransferase [Planctomycetota bacterium]